LPHSSRLASPNAATGLGAIKPSVCEEWRMKTPLGGVHVARMSHSGGSAIVPWYWFGADVNTSAADEDDRDRLKM